MRTTLAKAVYIVTLTAIGMSAADNSLGTWKRNMERTKYDQKNPPSNPITSQTMIREAAEGGVKITTRGMRKDGTTIDTTCTVKYDGKSVPCNGTGSQFDTISMKQIDANAFAVETKKAGGKYHTTGRIVVSKDGKTMTNTSKGTDAEGKPISFNIVLDKQ
jgi:hypothetical protein